jgi:DNA ligase-associated metallophosphoesterase
MLRVEIGGAPLHLLPERAAYLPEQRTLLVADLHAGKAASFRGLGVPVPRGSTTRTLERLSLALEATAAQRLVFLGDFLHSSRSQGPATLGALVRWRTRHAGVAMLLLRGNHDQRAGDPPAALDIEVVDGPLACGAYMLTHEPAPHARAYVLAGHVHPCVVVSGRGFDRLRLPCFHFGTRVGVLPAFGDFTGAHAVRRTQGDRVFAVAGGGVHEIRIATDPKLGGDERNGRTPDRPG